MRGDERKGMLSVSPSVEGGTGQDENTPSINLHLPPVVLSECVCDKLLSSHCAERFRE